MSMVFEKTVSIWESGRAHDKELSSSELTGDLQAEIVVVGAGIAGLSVAYALSLAGRQVVVIDDGDIGGGNTGRTTAHLSNAIDDRFVTLRRERGDAVARIAAESHGAAIDAVERIQRDEGIDCDFHRVDGYLLLSPGDKESLLDEEADAAREAGIPVERLPEPPAGIPSAPCIRFPRQARFNPIAYVKGLARAIEQRGGRIFSGAHVVSVEDGETVTIETASGHKLTARAAVVATATPINDQVKMHTKIAPYRSYAIAARVAPGEIPDALIWDTQDPYHYVRLAEHEGALYAILGGEDHKSGQAEDERESLARLEEWGRASYPIQRIDFRWSGQVMETIDGLGFIGRNPGEKNVYIVTGDSGMGMTHGVIAGLLIPHLIETGNHPWEEAYDPARKPLKSAGTFLEEQANVAAQFKDYITGSEVSGLDDIPVGEGAVLRHGLSKVAAFRDDRGKLHVRSAVCPHLACIVHWNTLEKVWDCPCHGSQFAPTGQVLHGPATSPLKTVEDFNQARNPNIDKAKAV